MSELKILITQDSRDDKQISKAILAEKGYRVEVCKRDGREVFKSVKETLPDVVIMDMNMPSYDAPAVCKAIQNSDIVRKPVIIIVSSHHSEFMEIEASESGASLILMKPFDYDVLCERIDRLCSLRIETGRKSERRNVSDIDLEVMVTDVMHQIGIPAHLNGYPYLRTGIILCIENRDMINRVTKELYPTIAQKHKSTATRVERSIRHAIESAWDRGNVDVLNAYFGYTIHTQKGKPTNSEFIAMIADKICLKIKIM